MSRGPIIPPTVVLPNPGGGGPGGAYPATVVGGLDPRLGPRLAPRVAQGFDAAEARPGVNPLVDAASDLFDLVVYLQAQATPLDIGPLRLKAEALVNRFDAKATAAGVEADLKGVARYAIAATIDDQVMALPWGVNSGWPNATLVGALYGEVIGGERFFEYLDHAVADPNRCGDLIEFMYICLSLGFKGAYRRRAPQELEVHRAKAFEAIRVRRRGFAEGLSLRWRGVEATRKPLREIAPLWLVASLSLAACAGLFFAAVFAVGGETSRAVAAATSLPPMGEVAIVTLDPPAPPPPPPPPPPQENRVRGFLEPEIARGVVSVFQEGGQVRIRLTGEGMFASARASLLPEYQEILRKVATALNGEPGRVKVEGHSDAVPIRTARFPSNFHLSEARAAAVAAFMKPLLDRPDRLDVIGIGAAQPLDPANPRSGVNRRVELVLDREVPTQ